MADVLRFVEGKFKYTPPALQFGLRGGAKCEECSAVSVWVRLMGRASVEHWRFNLPPDMPLERLRGVVTAAVGHEVDQQCLVDERGYRFADLDTPVSAVSRECKLHVDLTYDDLADTRKYMKSKI